MSSMSRREQRAREKARPELNREHHDILVGHPYGASLLAFLESRGIAGLTAVESFADIICLAQDTNLDAVEALIAEWMQCQGYDAPRT